MLDNVKDKIVKHIQVRLDLLKLDAIQSSSGILSYFMFALICLLIFFSVILFAGFGLSEVFTDAGMSRSTSFLLTTGIYLVLLVIIVLLRRNVTRLFSNSFIKAMTENDEDDEDEDKKEK